MYEKGKLLKAVLLQLRIRHPKSRV